MTPPELIHPPTADRQPPTAPLPLAIDAASVALLLGLDGATAFLLKRRRLMKRGFPRALPMTPLRWSVVAVEQWVRDIGGAPISSTRASLAAATPERHPLVLAYEHGRAA